MLHDPGALERYIRAAVLPRFIQRLREIEDELAHLRFELERAHRELAASCGQEPELFARRWREIAGAWHLDAVNELIRQHNEYYPIERNLAVDPRTGDYVTVNGRSYRRDPIGPEWILERFPPSP
jgi:hypothetical protein